MRRLKFFMMAALLVSTKGFAIPNNALKPETTPLPPDEALALNDLGPIYSRPLPPPVVELPKKAEAKAPQQQASGKDGKDLAQLEAEEMERQAKSEQGFTIMPDGKAEKGEKNLDKELNPNDLRLGEAKEGGMPKELSPDNVQVEAKKDGEGATELNSNSIGLGEQKKPEVTKEFDPNQVKLAENKEQDPVQPPTQGEKALSEMFEDGMTG